MFRLFHWFKTKQGDYQSVKAAKPQPSGMDEGNRADLATADLEQRIIAGIRTVYDPELSVNVYDLGLIYDLEVAEEGTVEIRMTLTAPACPVAGSLPATVEEVVRQISGVTAANVDLVWDPPWSAERMSEAVRLQLGLL